VHWTETPALFLNGNIAPLSYDPAAAFPHALVGSDVTTWILNFGGSTSELFFQARGEFSNQTDRVYTLSGTSEAIPDLTYGVPLGAACTLTFKAKPAGGANPTTVQGSIAPLSWDTAASQPLNTPLSFSACDFTSTHLEFKARDTNTDTWEPATSDPTHNHVMNDDVINKRTLTWSWGGTPVTF
jgi:hypothetical protein